MTLDLYRIDRITDYDAVINALEDYVAKLVNVPSRDRATRKFSKVMVRHPNSSQTGMRRTEKGAIGLNLPSCKAVGSIGVMGRWRQKESD